MEWQRFIGWLGFHPSTAEIAHALKTDYLAKFGIKQIHFDGVSSDGTISAFGLTLNAQENWARDSTIFISTMRDHGLIQSYVFFQFSKAQPDNIKLNFLRKVDGICVPLALYLSFQTYRQVMSDSAKELEAHPYNLGAIDFSARQLAILTGMIEGKTNHELATELGYSVSTVRHETMRIYNLLQVSDRKEASKKAIALHLI